MMASLHVPRIIIPIASDAFHHFTKTNGLNNYSMTQVTSVGSVQGRILDSPGNDTFRDLAWARGVARFQTEQAGSGRSIGVSSIIYSDYFRFVV